ncbi:YkyA family protein [Neobacillus drentensis]|uniref:YkyA family protein n=1 Tax=Neobacillus drentensis TaxID=220684 RepID=UPI001F25AAC9|nr:YkyA family protein [Neobacillus drentensis]ULT58430.1 YkyA family protein [Neobacillus drentensis]
MLVKGRSSIILIVVAIIFILSGCAEKKTTIEKMYDVLENVVNKEKVFEEQQEPLVTLEKQEKEVYDQIIKQGMKEYDQIVKLSDEALALADKRKDRLDKETASLNESEQEFSKVTELKEQLEDPALKELANDLTTIMMKRYEAHRELYKQYSLALQYDKELYQMFKNKNLPLEDLEAQINKLNESYKKVYAANEQFNKYTEQYNETKLSFYKKAGLKTK